jgi:predicted HTH transcriptional regulator
MDLLDLLKRPEGKSLEFKCDLSSPDVALNTIVAFANTAGQHPVDRGGGSEPQRARRG